jgi:hypothetical protein
MGLCHPRVRDVCARPIAGTRAPLHAASQPNIERYVAASCVGWAGAYRRKKVARTALLTLLYVTSIGTLFVAYSVVPV